MKPIIFLSIVGIFALILGSLAIKADKMRAVDGAVWQCEQESAKRYATLNVKYKVSVFKYESLKYEFDLLLDN